MLRESTKLEYQGKPRFNEYDLNISHTKINTTQNNGPDISNDRHSYKKVENITWNTQTIYNVI